MQRAAAADDATKKAMMPTITESDEIVGDAAAGAAQQASDADFNAAGVDSGGDIVTSREIMCDELAADGDDDAAAGAGVDDKAGQGQLLGHQIWRF